MIYGTIIKLVLVSVILIVLVVTGLTFIPSTAQKAVNEVSQIMPSVDIMAQPCNYYCLAKQTDWELFLLRSYNYGVRDYTKAIDLPTYFSCNYDILELAMHAISLGKWEAGFLKLYFGKLTCQDGLIITGSLGTFNLCNFNIKNQGSIIDNECTISYNTMECETDDESSVYCDIIYDPTICQSLNNEIICDNKKCTVLYTPEVCTLVCGDGINPEVTGLWQFDLGSDFKVSVESSNKFKKIYNYNIINIYYPAPIVQGIIGIITDMFNSLLPDWLKKDYLPEYGILVESSLLLLPKGLKLRPVTEKYNQTKEIEPYLIGFRDYVLGVEQTNPYYFENSTKLMYDCFSGNGCDNHYLHNLKELCKVDPLLEIYDYVNCNDPRSIAEKINPYTFNYEYRSGADIKRGFYCTGEDYNACLYEPAKYGSDCQPAWRTLRTRKGRCEDFAILYYTIFKTMGLTDDQITFYSGQATLPSSCMKLQEECNIEFTEEYNAAPQLLTLNNLGTFDACSNVMSVPAYGANYSTVIGGERFIIHSPFNDDWTINAVQDAEGRTFASNLPAQYYALMDFETGVFHKTENEYSGDLNSAITNCASYVRTGNDFIIKAKGACGI